MSTHVVDMMSSHAVCVSCHYLASDLTILRKWPFDVEPTLRVLRHLITVLRPLLLGLLAYR